MKKIGYKVVRRASTDSYFSLLAPIPLVYKLNDTTEPEEDGGPLCLFADKSLAVSWVSNRSKHLDPPAYILRCEYEPWDNKLPRVMVDPDFAIIRERGVRGTARFFYEVRPTLIWQGIMTHMSRLPAGTRLAKSITPLEVVHETW
jgi:hypothetical protein